MAARNSAWSPGRSILCVALVASACFVIVVVGASRHEFGEELEARDSGSGGFSLVAESAVPLHQSLGREADLFDLGFSDDQIELLKASETVPLRLLPGEDASCLNLYRPEKPRILGVPPELVARGGFGFRQHVDLPSGMSDPWELLDQPLEEGVVPAIGDFNSVMWILHLGLNQELTVEDEFGEPLRLRLVGLLDTSIFQSELLISEAAFRRAFPGRSGYSYFLIDTAPEQVGEMTEAVERTLSPFGFDATTTREKLTAFKVVENTYMSTFQILGGLGLLLGTVGLGVVLLRNVIERRGELATLRAFGYRRARLARLVLAETAFLLLTGMVVGTLAALAAVAPRLTTIHAPWGSLGATLVLVLLVGMLSCLAAVRGALRIPLLPALKAER